MPNPPELKVVRGAVELFERDEACSYGWLGNVAIVIGHAPPRTTTVPNYEKCIADLARKFPTGIGLITIVQTTSTPEPAARDLILQIFCKHGPSLNACLFVDEAVGFQAAIHRSIGAGLILATGKRATIRIAGTMAPGISWFSSRWGLPRAKEQILVTQLARQISDFYTNERDLRGARHVAL